MENFQGGGRGQGPYAGGPNGGFTGGNKSFIGGGNNGFNASGNNGFNNAIPPFQGNFGQANWGPPPAFQGQPPQQWNGGYGQANAQQVFLGTGQHNNGAGGFGPSNASGVGAFVQQRGQPAGQFDGNTSNNGAGGFVPPNASGVGGFAQQGRQQAGRGRGWNQNAGRGAERGRGRGNAGRGLVGRGRGIRTPPATNRQLGAAPNPHPVVPNAELAQTVVPPLTAPKQPVPTAGDNKTGGKGRKKMAVQVPRAWQKV